PTTRRSARSSRTCTTAASGWRARAAGCACVSPPPGCAASTSSALRPCSRKSKPAKPHRRERAADHARKDQARVLGRHRPLLHDDEEQAHHARQARDQEIRSEGAQARHLQRNQVEVTERPKTKKPA